MVIGGFFHLYSLSIDRPHAAGFFVDGDFVYQALVFFGHDFHSP
jgi:hypothetical protein